MKAAFSTAVSLLLGPDRVGAWSFSSVLLGGQNGVPDDEFSAVPLRCRRWLDDSGDAIARPKRYKGRRLPRGNCHSLLWLNHRLACEEHVCVSIYVPDRLRMTLLQATGSTAGGETLATWMLGCGAQILRRELDLLRCRRR